MRISDWSSDVCSSDVVGAIEVLVVEDDPRVLAATVGAIEELGHRPIACGDPLLAPSVLARHPQIELIVSDVLMPTQTGPEMIAALAPLRSEEHTSELQSLMRSSYAAFCLKKKQ